MHELDVFNCPLDGVNLIEASAGTGKTWNICGLYLRLLLEQRRKVEEVLVVTFTKAATAELRERIRSRLVELARALGTADGVKNDAFIEAFMQSVIKSGRVERQEAAQRIELALQSFDEAAIFTIHGFCQRALAETPFAASQPFRLDFLADDRAIQREVALDFWRRQVAQADLPAGLAAHLLNTGFGPEQLAAQLGRRLQKPLSILRWPDFAITSVPSMHELERAFADARRLWRQEAPAVAGTILAALDQLHGATYKEQSVSLGAAAWNQYFAGGDPLAALDDKQRLLAADHLASKTKKNCLTPSHRFFGLAEQVIGLRRDILACFDLQRLQLLHDWLAHGPEELLRRKQERRQVSYDDLLAKLHRALTGDDLPWLAAALRQRYPCALIDEFQDTDPVQFQIFSRIYLADRRGPIFLVGDPKQAIYSFRSADLNTYLAARSAADVQYTLSANQRSTPGLIKALNLLFAANQAAFILDGLDYQEVAVGSKPRKPFRDLSGPGADLQLWMLPSAAELLPKAEARPLAIQATAAEISRLLGEAREDGRISIDQLPLKPVDIAVIVRSHAQGSAMKQALTALGVGCVELDQASIFSSCQAEEVERLLQAVADPTCIGMVKAALATELMGLNGQTIADVNDDDEQLTDWLQRFQDYRALWLEHGFGVMWRTLLRHERAAARLLPLPGGERMLTNLLHLGELLQQAAATQAGIEGLLRWLAQSRRAQQDSADETAQLRLESDENLVQILTIHKAKGLEFPVVFCPFLFDGRAGGAGNRLSGLEYHLQEQGIIDFSLDEAQLEAGTAIAKREAAAEEARLLYVALTRAVYRCYLVAGCYGVSYGGRLSPKESLRSPLNWLAAGAGVDFAEWQSGEREVAAITDAWQTLAERGAGQIALAPLPMTVGSPLPSDPQASASFSVRQARRALLDGWRLGSFSALNRQSGRDSVVPDHDAGPVDPALFRSEPQAAVEPIDFLRFPVGPAAGECLHRALELTDFSDPATWDGAILRGLRERPPSAEDLPEATLAAMLQRLFVSLMSTPLPEGLRLETLTRDRCLTELEFCFPTGSLVAGDLNRLLAVHGYDQPRLSFAPLHGFIKGFIDLVFCHEGRYYLLDWKSNHLGHAPDDYRPEAIAHAMRHHGYHLQYLIYSVALHRYLRHRLADYDFNRHFGGCFYLFVRAIRPGWLNADGSACGAYFHRPQLACVEELDRLFATA